MVLSLPQIQLKLQADDPVIGMNIAEAEVGVLAILDFGDTALAATELGCHLRLGETGGYPGDNKLVDELGLGRKLTNGIGHPAIAMSAEHLIDATIGSHRGGRAAAYGLK